MVRLILVKPVLLVYLSGQLKCVKVSKVKFICMLWFSSLVVDKDFRKNYVQTILIILIWDQIPHYLDAFGIQKQLLQNTGKHKRMEC